MRRLATVALFAAVISAANAGPVAVRDDVPSSATAGESGSRLAHQPVVRRYEVREDESGRLVRVAVWSRTSGGSRQAAPRNLVVQGRSSRSSQAGGRLDIDSLVRQVGRRHNVDPKLIDAVIRQESDYNPFAISHKGARGLMQLMPLTAVRFGVQDIFDPAENVEGGVKLLRYLLDRYDGDRSRTLAAYNAGEEAVDRYGGIPPYEETQDFVERVSRFYRDGNGSGDETDVQSETHARIVVHVDPSGLIRFETERR